MKEKTNFFFLVLCILVIFLIIANSFIRDKYDINLWEYLQYMPGLNVGDKLWLQQHGPLIYGADRNAPPLRFVDSDGQYKGVVVDYINVLSLELGLEIKVKPLVWEDALKSLAEGKTDICDMFYSEERAKNYLFTDSIYNLRTVLLVRKSDEEITSLSDLTGKTLALQKGDYAVGYVQGKLKNDAGYIFVNDIKEAIQLLVKGRVRGVVGDEPVANYFINQLGVQDEVRIVNPPLYERDTCLAVPKDHDHLVHILNKAIFSLKRRKTMEAIQQKWFGLSAPIVKVDYSQKLLFTLAILLLLLILIALFFNYWNRILQQEVENRTRELVLKKKELETIFDGITSLMVVINEKCRIENVNQAFSRFLGLKKGKLIGLDCREVMNKLGLICSDCLIQKAINPGKKENMRINIASRVFEVITYLLHSGEEEVKRVLVVFRDITDKLINEKKLLQDSKMVAIGQLASGMAHEIRNPLGLIRTHLFLLKGELKKDSREIQKSFKVMENAIDRISRIIHHLLDFSRSKDREFCWVNLYSFISEIFEFEKKVFQRNKINFELHGDRKLECWLVKEPLEHIIINLLSNAVDAMPEGGKLIVSFKDEEGNLILRVSDTGQGIPPEEQKNIFNPFYTTKKPDRGTGLGLYIVYNEVQKLGGEIRLESKPGEGTSFFIHLPLKIRRSSHGS